MPDEEKANLVVAKNSRNTSKHTRPVPIMSMFRASPWVSYDPTITISHQNSLNANSEQSMDDDVDMDAPQISTLREEETPPPAKKPASSSRKAKATPKKAPEPRVQPRVERIDPASEDDFDEPEEEEDQLIDDDDDMLGPSQHATRPSDASTQKRKSNTSKRKQKKSEKPAEGEKKVKEKATQPTGPPNLAPTMTWFEATPSESHKDVGNTEPLSVSHSAEPQESSSVKSTPKKAKVPRIILKTKAKAVTKQKTAVPPLLAEDAGIVSEGYTGTAASSPVTAHLDLGTPEVEPGNVTPPAPFIEEPNLENVPIPVYPLPTKPFPVQLPPKIATGFAPVLPLDRSAKKVRHWRTANREIRGIAGGRWFARTWVGEKESEYATALAAASANAKEEGKAGNGGMTIPKLSAVSISAPGGKSKSKGSKTASLAASAAPSRSSSAVPDIPAASIVRAPTKLRMLQMAPTSDAGDSDMAPPPES